MSEKIALDDAMVLVNRVCGEVGNHVDMMGGGWIKIINPTTKHKIYIQKTKFLNKIDTSLPIKGEPGTAPIDKDNGAITCRIVPDLEQLEMRLRQIADRATPVHAKNRPRPFGVTKLPRPRVPTPASAAPVSGQAQVRAPELQARLDELAARRRAAVERRKQEEEQEQSERERLTALAERGDEAAEEILRRRRSGSIDPDDAEEAMANSGRHELLDELRESGIEVD